MKRSIVRKLIATLAIATSLWWGYGTILGAMRNGDFSQSQSDGFWNGVFSAFGLLLNLVPSIILSYNGIILIRKRSIPAMRWIAGLFSIYVAFKLVGLFPDEWIGATFLWMALSALAFLGLMRALLRYSDIDHTPEAERLSKAAWTILCFLIFSLSYNFAYELVYPDGNSGESSDFAIFIGAGLTLFSIVACYRLFKFGLGRFAQRSLHPTLIPDAAPRPE